MSGEFEGGASESDMDFKAPEQEEALEEIDTSERVADVDKAHEMANVANNLKDSAQKLRGEDVDISKEEEDKTVSKYVDKTDKHYEVEKIKEATSFVDQVSKLEPDDHSRPELKNPTALSTESVHRSLGAEPYHMQYGSDNLTIQYFTDTDGKSAYFFENYDMQKVDAQTKEQIKNIDLSDKKDYYKKEFAHITEKFGQSGWTEGAGKGKEMYEVLNKAGYGPEQIIARKMRGR